METGKTESESWPRPPSYTFFFLTPAGGSFPAAHGKIGNLPPLAGPPHSHGESPESAVQSCSRKPRSSPPPPPPQFGPSFFNSFLEVLTTRRSRFAIGVEFLRLRPPQFRGKKINHPRSQAIGGPDGPDPERLERRESLSCARGETPAQPVAIQVGPPDENAQSKTRCFLFLSSEAISSGIAQKFGPTPCPFESARASPGKRGQNVSPCPSRGTLMEFFSFCTRGFRGTIDGQSCFPVLNNTGTT